MSGALRLDVVRTSEGMAELFREEKNCPARSFFQTESWMDAWWNVYREGKSPCAAKVVMDGRTAAIFPLFVRRRGDGGPWACREMRLVGTGEKVETDFHDFPALPEVDDGVLRMLFVDFLAETKTSWDEVILADFDELSRIHGALVHRRESLPFRTIVEKGVECPFQDLPDSPERFAKDCLSTTFRRRLKNKMNKLERETGLRFEVHDGCSGVVDVMRLFAELHQARWTGRGEKGAFHDPKKVDFLNSIAVRAGAEGTLFLSLLTMDGALAAGRLGFLRDGVLYDYQATHDPARLKSSPGLISVWKTIDAAIDRGATRFEALRGTEDYKRHFAHSSRWTHRLRIFNDTPRGLLGYAAARSGAEWALRKAGSAADRVAGAFR